MTGTSLANQPHVVNLVTENTATVITNLYSSPSRLHARDVHAECTCNVYSVNTQLLQQTKYHVLENIESVLENMMKLYSPNARCDPKVKERKIQTVSSSMIVCF
jgi:hypothetical protein